MAQLDKTVDDPFTRRKCTPKMVTKVSHLDVTEISLLTADGYYSVRLVRMLLLWKMLVWLQHKLRPHQSSLWSVTLECTFVTILVSFVVDV